MFKSVWLCAPSCGKVLALAFGSDSDLPTLKPIDQAIRPRFLLEFSPPHFAVAVSVIVCVLRAEGQATYPPNCLTCSRKQPRDEGDTRLASSLSHGTLFSQ